MENDEIEMVFTIEQLKLMREALKGDLVRSNDIYHEIGYIYCTTLEDIKRIDYHEIKEVGGEDE